MYCENCGESIETRGSFCTNCGAKIAYVKNPKEDGAHVEVIYIIIVIIVLLVFVVPVVAHIMADNAYSIYADR